MKRKVLQALVILGVLMMSIAIFAAPTIRVVVNGERVIFPDAQPYMDENNRILIPVRFVSEELGAKVDWYPANKKVVITKDDTVVNLIVGQKKITVNDVTKELDTKATIKNTRTFVPLRFVSEALGAVVEWDGKGNSVYISSNGKPIVKDKVLSHEGFIVEEKDIASYNEDKYSDTLCIFTHSNLNVFFELGEGAKANKEIITAFPYNGGSQEEYERQCGDLKGILSCQVGEKCVNDVMNYLKQKVDRHTKLPVKTFKDTNYRIEIEGYADGEVSVIVYKK